jgi:hypothetical protein
MPLVNTSDFSITELQVLQPEYRVIKDEDVNQTLLRFAGGSRPIDHITPTNIIS